jgi:hypothetical protein
MYVNKVIFLVTFSRHIRFGTAERINSRREEDVTSGLKSIVKLYKSRGFKVDVFLGDGEFKPLRKSIHELGGQLNITSNDEHVGDVERYIGTVKERTRASFHSTPFKKLPIIMIQHLVGGSVFWLNAFPSDGGITGMSPRAIMTGKMLDYMKHCRLMFGAYAQVHEEHNNSMEARTTGAIALQPTGNDQGGYYFMSLTTGRQLNRNHWTELPMPQDVVEQVHKLARQSFASKDIVFQFRDGAAVDDDDESAADPDYYPEDSDNDDDNGDNASLEPESELDDDASLEPESEPGDIQDGSAMQDNDSFDMIGNDNEDTEMSNKEIAGVGGDITGVPDAVNDEEDSDEAIEIEGKDDTALESEGNDVDDVKEDAVEAMDEEPSLDSNQQELNAEANQQDAPRQHSYDLRPRKPRSYKHKHPDLEDVIMTQLSLKKGLLAFGDEGAAAVMNELKQLHDKDVMEPRPANMLTKEEKRRALQYLMYLKKKRCGRIKGRGCADGRKQRVYKSKEESSSPTVAVESLFLTAVIDAKEGRAVATCDIPGAFLHAYIDKILHMHIDGPMAKLLVEIDPDQYEPCLTEEHGKPVIYVRLKKALYGTLQAALLFWRDLSGFLIDNGFVLNPYDECVANKDIKGSQCTIVWHVDDLKISHVDPQVTADIVQLLQEKYGTEDAPVTVSHGKVHDYLGMTLDYTQPNKVIINMDQYVNELLDNVPEDYGTGIATTPAATHLYDVNPDAEKLEQKKAELFHTLTAKLLFLSKRARPDLQQAVGFLTTRVKQPDVDDWKKLNRVMKYLRGTKDLKLTLEADNTHVIKWWVDAAFAVHGDMRSQTGMTMSMGKGSVYASSV